MQEWRKGGRLRIAYTADNYAARRLIIGKIRGAKYIRIFSLNRFIFFFIDVLRKIGFKLDKQYSYFANTCFGIFVKGEAVKCIHFFNQISLSSSLNWISQFETALPRYKTFNTRIIKTIADKHCKAILPLSKCAYNIALNRLTHFPKYKNEIVQKMFVLHPPQELLLNNIIDKKKNDKLTFVFVGNDFFQKGGMELLSVFEKFNCKLLLIIISRMNVNDFVTRSTVEHKKQALDFFVKNSSWLNFYNGLPNNEVLEIIKKSDIGLLPTKADTYGYSVLEMQAAGVPVISTNVRALPEINNNECGWLIPVSKNEIGEALYSNEQELSNLCREIENGLYSIIGDIISEYETSGIDFIRKKGQLCLERISKEHNPADYENFLEKIIKGI